MLREKGIKVYNDDCSKRLADMLYENRESIFENYCVVSDDYQGDEWEHWKTKWSDNY